VQSNAIQDTDLNRCLANLRDLISLDLWRCKFSSSKTIDTIASSCKDLEEIDIGWCHHIFRREFDHNYFFRSCRKLKKVFLTSGRNVDDACLESIAQFCPDMEQLDVLGTNRITPEGVERVLKACPKLAFFDISFCSQISDMSELTVKYPRVIFKQSFQ
jgi:hypothetical protein